MLSATNSWFFSSSWARVDSRLWT